MAISQIKKKGLVPGFAGVTDALTAEVAGNVDLLLCLPARVNLSTTRAP